MGRQKAINRSKRGDIKTTPRKEGKIEVNEVVMTEHLIRNVAFRELVCEILTNIGHGDLQIADGVCSELQSHIEKGIISLFRSGQNICGFDGRETLEVSDLRHVARNDPLNVNEMYPHLIVAYNEYINEAKEENDTPKRKRAMVTTTTTSTLINVAGLDREQLLRKLWENAQPTIDYAMKVFCDDSLHDTNEFYIDQVEISPSGYVDYAFGRLIKTYVFTKEDEIDSSLYDKEWGNGSFRRIVDEMMM